MAPISAQSTVVMRDDIGVDEAFADRRRHRAAEKRAGEIKDCGHRDGLPRRQNFGRDDGRDRVGRIVKSVDVFENDRREDDDKKSEHTAA